MANYTRYGTPWVNGGAPGVSAAFLSALENTLIQPSGGSETGKYFLSGPAYTTGAGISQFMQSISRTTVPVSVTKDTADQSPAGMGTPTVQHLTHAGFQIASNSTTTTNSAFAGGNFTLNY